MAIQPVARDLTIGKEADQRELAQGLADQPGLDTGIAEQCRPACDAADVHAGFWWSVQPAGELPDRVFSTADLPEFLGALDYLFITMPLTPATTGLIGETELRMLKPSSVLINPARAAIIEEKAFIRALQEKWIRGASLDVHYAYPLPPEHALWELPNLIMTPHISGTSLSAQARYAAGTREILECWFEGRPIREEYIIVESGQLAGTGAQSYTVARSA